MASEKVAYLAADGTTVTVTPTTPLPTTSTGSPATLGQQTMANSTSVTIASNQTSVKTQEDAVNTTGGISQFKVNSSNTTNATSMKTTNSRLYGYCIQNSAATWAYLKFYNLNVAPTVGTSTVLSIVGIPPGGTVSWSSSIGVYMSVGIAYSILLDATDAGVTPLATANTVTGTIYAA